MMFKFKDETIGWFKQKITEAVANAIVYGLGIIFLWAVYVSISGEQQVKDISETLNTQMTNHFNEGVARDKDFDERISRIEAMLEHLIQKGGNKADQPAGRPERRTESDKDYYERYRKQYTPIQQQMAPRAQRQPKP